MRALIISFFYPPQETPRAFRTYTIVNELIRRGIKVDLVIPKIHGVSLRKNNCDNLTIYETIPGFFLNRKKGKECIPSMVAGDIKESLSREEKKEKIRRLRAKILRFIYWPSSIHSEFIFSMLSFVPVSFMFVVRKEYFDITISIGLPFSCHVATALMKKIGCNLGICYADYGDPYSFNPHKRRKSTSFDKWLESKTLAAFDFISVPVEKAIPAFKKLGVSANKIKVIPHGFDLHEKIVNNFHINRLDEEFICIYGGRFHKDVRDPTQFLKALCALKTRGIKFKFYIFTKNDYFSLKILDKFSKYLKEYLVIKGLIERKKLLSVMKDADFAVNFENMSEYQEPSKIIDFMFSRVKVLNVMPQDTSACIIDKIIKRNFKVYEPHPKYYINNVVDQFLENFT